MGRTKDLIKNASYFMIGNLGAKVIYFAMLPLYTHWMAPDAFGVVDIINSYNEILILLIGLGVSDALIVFPIGKKKQEIKLLFTTALWFHILCCVIFFLLFYVLSLKKDSLNLGSISNYLWLMFFLLITNSTLRLFQYLCRGIKKMSVFGYTGIISALCISLLSFMLIPKWGVKGFLMCGIIANLITTIFVIVYSKSYDYICISHFSRNRLKEMLSYSIPLIPNMFMWWFILSMNRPVIEKYVGIAAVGIFAVANKIPGIVGMFYNFFHQAWIATAVEEYESSDFQQYYNNVLKSLTFFQTIICLGIMSFGNFFIFTFVGYEYHSAIHYLPILCVSILFSNMATFEGSIFSANKQTKYLFYTVIIAAASSLILNFILIPIWGILGACISVLVAQVISVITRIFFLKKFLITENYVYHIFNIIICIAGTFETLFTHDLYRYVYILFLVLACFYFNRHQIKHCLSFIKSK